MSFFPKLTAKLTPFSKNCSICPKIYTIWNVNFTKKWHFCPKYPNEMIHNSFKKSTFLTGLQLFLPKIDSFAQKLMLRKTLVTLLQNLHDMILSLYLKIHSFTQKLTFCIKWYFLPKGNNTTWNWHFSKTGKTSLRKLNISTRN